jgi:nuclear pore complex protein Nup160
VPFQRNPTIRHDKINMELTAAASAAVATLGDGETPLLFTICLDHRMRIWDVGTGQILYTGDILNAKRDPQEVGKWTVDPSQTNLIRIIEETAGQWLVVTFSPLGAGEFKFWTVKANNQGSIHVADRFPEDQLIPPSPSTDVWTLADFAVADKGDAMDLWVLWKNNITYRSQRLTMRRKSHRPPFNEEWKGVFVDTTTPSVENSSSCDPVDATEKWLDTILHPGRFSKSTLETALVMYEKGLGASKEGSSRGGNKTLAESICTVLGSTTTLDRSSVGGMDYEQFRGTSETQWLRLWRLILEIDKLRGEALSLAVDVDTGMIWVVCAGCVATIRECSSLERVFHNLSSPEKNSAHLAPLISAGLMFTENFTDSMTQQTRAALQAELYEDATRPDMDQMQTFLDRARFWRQLSEEDCYLVTDTLGADFRMVTRRLYDDFLDLVAGSDSSEPLCPLTELGRKLVVRTVQETVDLHYKIIFSQLVLLVHMEFEIDREEDALHSRFDVGSIYRKLLSALKRLEHIKWMTRTELSVSIPKPDRSSSASASTSFSTSLSTSFSSSISLNGSPTTTKKGSEEPRILTPLEGLLGHLLGLPDAGEQDLLENITELAVNICAPGSEVELIPSLQQCWLLKIDRPDLALELSPFSDQEPFSTYVQGRVFLALKDFETASSYFKKASIGLGMLSQETGRHSAGLLDDTEWNLLHTGLLSYYTHIVNLFDRHKAYSFVIEFARLGLQFPPGPRESPLIRTEVQSRLFAASIAISHFDTAHTILLSMDDEALQKSYLRKLIERMCETGQNAELVSLPFSGLHMKVDAILLEKCKMTKDVINDIPYHQILYSWRVSHDDFRGGATILMDRLQKLKALGAGDKIGSDNVMDTEVTKIYLLIINALSCVEKDNHAYIFQDLPMPSEEEAQREDQLLKEQLGGTTKALDQEPGQNRPDPEDKIEWLLEECKKRAPKHPPPREPPRKMLTLADLRKEYQQELDRIVAIQTNQFALTGEDDAMDLA